MDAAGEDCATFADFDSAPWTARSPGGDRRRPRHWKVVGICATGFAGWRRRKLICGGSQLHAMELAAGGWGGSREQRDPVTYGRSGLYTASGQRGNRIVFSGRVQLDLTAAMVIIALRCSVS